MSAVISDCKTYRYRLERGTGRSVAFIMVNPSTADEVEDDQTIRKCQGFAARFHCDRIIVGNKFAFRSKDVNDLRSARDPVGPENDRHIEQILRDADLHVAAWGALAKLPETLRGRWKDIVRIADRVGVRLHVIGYNADGHPRHPLMTSYNTFMSPWTVPWFAGRETPPSSIRPDAPIWRMRMAREAYIPIQRPWTWNTATPLERAEAVRSHLLKLGAANTAHIFNLTEDGLDRIRRGCQWAPEYERNHEAS